jgi:hypothetical protein
MTDTLSADLSVFVKKTSLLMKGLPEAVGTAALERVQELTPVKTGNLRASWRVIPTSESIVIGTNVEYAPRIEYGFVGTDKLGRSYHVDGRHMLGQTLFELPQITEREINKLRARL